MATIEVGKKAPSFTALTQTGEKVSLSDFKGKKVVLYFYPKDDTPGCTKEACTFRDEYKHFNKANTVVLGVSPDSPQSHQKFAEKFSLPFPLIADEDKTIVNAYGFWVEKSMYGKKYMGVERSTVLIDENGVITEIYRKVKPEEHPKEILESIKS